MSSLPEAKIYPNGMIAAVLVIETGDSYQCLGRFVTKPQEWQLLIRNATKDPANIRAFAAQEVAIPPIMKVNPDGH